MIKDLWHVIVCRLWDHWTVDEGCYPYCMRCDRIVEL